MARFGLRRPVVAPPDAGGAAAAASEPPEPDRVEVCFDRLSVRRTLVLGFALLTVWLVGLWVFQVTAHFLFLMLLAWLLAVAMEPMIRWLLRRGTSRGVATAITGVSGLVGALVLAALFGSALISQLVELVKSLPAMVTDVVDWLNSTFHLTLDPTAIVNSLGLSSSDVAHAAESLAGGLLGVVGSVTSVTFDTFTVVVFAFYFAASGPKLLQALVMWMPPERQRVAGTVWEITAEKTGGYVVSKIVLAAMSAFFHGAFFWLIGLPSWLPMALLVGITAQFIPMIGTYIGIIIPVIVALFSDPLDAVWIIAFATVYQQIETYYFTPRISRRTMDVHPAIALAAVFVGAAIWGPLGAIIGIPLAAAGVAIAQTYGRRYEIVADVQAEAEVAGAASTPT